MTAARKTWFVVLVGFAGWVAVGFLAYAQTPKVADKPAAEWNGKDDYPTTCPDIVVEKGEDDKANRDKLPEVVVLEGDPPQVKAAKRRLVALLAQIDLSTQRIAAGQFTGSTAYHTLVTALSNTTETAGLVWDKPEQLAPWHEWRLRTLKELEHVIQKRVEGELEIDPSTYPQLVAERYAAEIALLKLRERAKK